MIHSTIITGVDFFNSPSSSPQADLPRSWRCEIRGRLNVILGFAELLSDDPATSPRNRRFAENIRAAGVRLLHAVEQSEPLVSDRRITFPPAEDTS